MATIDEIAIALNRAADAGDHEAAKELATAYNQLKASSSEWENNAPVEGMKSDFEYALEKNRKSGPIAGIRALARAGAEGMIPFANQFKKEDYSGPESQVIYPVAKEAMKIGGNVALGTGVAGALGKGAELAKLPQLAKALASSGAEGKSIAQQLLAGGLTGGTTSFLTNPEDTLSGAAVGAVTPVALKGLGSVLSKTYDLGSGNLAKVNAGKIARGILGEQEQATRTALEHAPEDLTASQAGYNIAPPAWASLGQIAENTRGEPYLAKSRTEMANIIRNIRENTPNLAKSLEVRSNAKNITYPIAEAEQIKTTPEILGLLNRMPSEALNSAKDINKFSTGYSSLVNPNFTYEFGNNPYITGKSTLNIAKALKDMVKAPSTENKGVNKSIELGNLRSKFLDVMENASTPLRTAREEYRQNSIPVNQAQIMGEYLTKLTPAKGQYNPSGFRTAMGESGQESLLKNTLGNKTKGNLSEHLTDNQLEALKKAESQFIRNEDLSEQAQAGYGTAKDIIDKNIFLQKLPNTLNPKIALLNKTLGVAEQRIKGAVGEELAKGMVSPKTALQMLDTLPADQRDTFIRLLRQSGPTLSRAAVAETNQQ